MPAKSKRLTNKEKALKSKVKKELQEQGLLPPDKPRLNRRKFAKEAAEQFDKEINLMNPMDVFWFHNALTLVTAGTDVQKRSWRSLKDNGCGGSKKEG